ncbi:radical SAM protein [Seleniivibrio woodruffii]|uniref:radical SAM protein n=1 Tax=Seleniivibrio woodruffii TaxID=1078050 RepID=UPI0026EA5BCC|nr:radical SAM protein [Seleniivibrio woodruffii]
MSVYLHFEGVCFRRRLDTEKLREYFILNGFDITDNPDDAENIIYYCCAFNTYREDVGLEKIKGFLSKNLFVLEGLAKTAKDSLIGLGVKSDRIIPLENMSILDAHFAEKVRYKDVGEQNHPDGNRKQFAVMTSRGCLDNCSYCGDKTVVGDLISKPLEEILEEVRRGVALGYQRILFLGDDVGAYGLDIGLTVFDMFDEVFKVSGNFKINIGELNVKYFIKEPEKFEKLCSSGRIASLAVGFQSGSDRILELMQRGYTKQGLLNMIRILNKYGIPTHFHAIAGFPAETEEDFMDTVDVLAAYPFYSCSMFIYLERGYSGSCEIFPKVPADTVLRRLEKVRGILGENYRYVMKPDKLRIMSKEKYRQCMIVVGSNRCGTSAMTGLLEKAGVTLGRKLLAPSENNKKGYFEDERLIAFNDKVMAEAGTYWDDIAKPQDYLDSVMQTKNVEELKAIITEEYGRAPYFALKDPRICAVLPLYLRALDEMSIDVRIIRMIRHPFEAAQSLSKVMGFNIGKSLLIWCLNNIYSEIYSEDFGCLRVNYDDLLSDRKGVLERVEEYTGMEMKTGDDDFIDSSMKRSVNTDRSDVDGFVRDFSLELFEALKTGKDIGGLHAVLKDYLNRESGKISRGDALFYRERYHVQLPKMSRYEAENRYMKLRLEAIGQLAQHRRLAVFGLGVSGMKTIEFLTSYYPERLCFVVDDNRTGSHNGVPVISSADLLGGEFETDALVCGRFQRLNPALETELKIPLIRLELIV